MITIESITATLVRLRGDRWGFSHFLVNCKACSGGLLLDPGSRIEFCMVTEEKQTLVTLSDRLPINGLNCR